MKSIVFIAAGAASFCVMAQVELATPFGDNVVLQRDMPVPVWGTADAGETVEVTFAGQKKSAKAGEDGRWSVTLDAMRACKEGRTLAAKGSSGASEARNAVVGEVWFASGQSNMECPIWGPDPRYRDCKGAMMIRSTHKPLVRFVKNKHIWSETPKTLERRAWRGFTPDSFDGSEVARLSAVAYYYALEIYSALDIPVGIVDSSWGGTVIDAWTPPSGYENRPELADVAAKPFRKDVRLPHHQRSALWNGMVSSWTPMAMRGFIWYQGCSNNFEAHRYASKMHALYGGWAKEFANPGLKLYFVELAPFRTNWFELQRAQMKFAAEEDNAALAVVCDAGNIHDIHPNDKEIVAKRLALHALKRDYGIESVRDNSPVLKSWRIEGDTFVMEFSDAESWYVYSPDYSTRPLFEIAGRGGKFVPAKLLDINGRGIVKGRELRVKADGVKEPLRLRYLARAPYNGTLYSDASLPLGPFDIDARTNRAVRIGAPVKLGEAEKIPELAGWRKALTLDIPVNARYADNPPPAPQTEGDFTRVAYLLELERYDGTVDWAMTAFDAPTSDVRNLGVPCRSGVAFQTTVSNLTVRANLSGIEQVTDYDGGSIEFWPHNYGHEAVFAGIGGDGNCYDFNDKPNPRQDGRPGYGCMQVHDWKRGATIWALNNFNGADPVDAGIGDNEAGDNPDWTFMKNGASWKTRRLTVFVK